MAYEIPSELIDIQRAWFAAHAHLLEVSAKLPLGQDIVAGEAEISDEQRAELEAARAEELRLIDELYDDKWRAGMDNESAYRKQLQDAARE